MHNIVNITSGHAQIQSGQPRFMYSRDMEILQACESPGFDVLNDEIDASTGES